MVLIALTKEMRDLFPGIDESVTHVSFPEGDTLELAYRLHAAIYGKKSLPSAAYDAVKMYSVTCLNIASNGTGFSAVPLLAESLPSIALRECK